MPPSNYIGWDRYEAYCTAARDVAKEFNTLVVEVDELFIKEPERYFLKEDVHLTAQGNFLIAKNIVGTLRKNGFIK